MVEELEFKEWWKEYSRSFTGMKDGGREQMERLHSTVKTFTKEKREAFITELFNHDLDEFACSLMADFGNEIHKLEVRKRANRYLENKEKGSRISTYILAILKSYTPKDYEFIEGYFLKHQKDAWFHIPDLLFVVNNDLFLKTYKRKLPTYSNDNLYKYDGLLDLTTNLEAFEFLIKNMSWFQARRLKKLALIKSKHSTISKNTQEKLIKLSKM